MLLILFVALIVFGPARLQDIARGLGKAVNSFRKASSEFNKSMTVEMERAKAEQERHKEGANPAEISHLPSKSAVPAGDGAGVSTSSAESVPSTEKNNSAGGGI